MKLGFGLFRVGVESGREHLGHILVFTAVALFCAMFAAQLIWSGRVLAGLLMVVPVVINLAAAVALWRRG